MRTLPFALLGAMLSFSGCRGVGPYSGQAGLAEAVSGSRTGQAAATQPPQPADTDALRALRASRYSEVWDHIRKYYPRSQPSDQELADKAIESLIKSLGDSPTRFFSQKENWAASLSPDSYLFGLGLDRSQNPPTVAIVRSYSPADKAGLRVGDRILAVNGTLAADIPSGPLPGGTGLELCLSVNRDGWPVPKDIIVSRPAAVTELVRWRLETSGGKRIAVITLADFSPAAKPQFDAAVGEIVAAAADGLILDLRHNPGGETTTLQGIAAVFLGGQRLLLTAQLKDGRSMPVYTSDLVGPAPFAGKPLVVLVNHQTASAAEILAGALQDYGLAWIMGENTYGKGSGQGDKEFADGAVFRMTMSLWRTPKGRFIDKVGLVPDEVVEAPPAAKVKVAVDEKLTVTSVEVDLSLLHPEDRLELQAAVRDAVNVAVARARSGRPAKTVVGNADDPQMASALRYLLRKLAVKP